MNRLELNGQLVAELDDHEALMLQNLTAAGFRARLAAPMTGTHIKPEVHPTSAVTAQQLDKIDVYVQFTFVRERTVPYDAHPRTDRRHP